MKRVLFTSIQLFLLFFAVSAVAQLNVWRPQNPPTIAGNLKAIQMISPYTAYVVGDANSFIVTSDSGRKWNVKTGIAPDKFKQSITLNSLSFIDSTTGMTMGNGLALKTTDAGKTWSNVAIPGPNKYSGVLMLSQKIVIVIGASGLIVRTIDSGKTWTPFPLENGNDLLSIRKVKEDFIVITAKGGYLFTSSDSGANWKQKFVGLGNDVHGVAFEDEKTAVAVGEGGFVATTGNQGDTWLPHTWDTMSFIVSSTLNSVDTKVPGFYVAVGNYGTLVYSTDGGYHWSKGKLDVFLTSGLNFNSVWMWNKDYGFAAGDLGFIVKTTDGGATWDFIPQDPLFSRMYGIAFPKGDSSHGITVGFGGAVMTTSDGGKKWSMIKSKYFTYKTNIYDVTFSDAKTAFACGEWGAIYKSSDYGATWDSLRTPTPRILKHICFVDKDYGWAAGDRNVLIKTTNGGANWSFIFNENSPDTVSGVSFCDRLNGITGRTITTDGGTTWKIVKFPIQYDLPYTYIGCHMVSPTRFAISVYTNGFGSLLMAIGDSMYGVSAGETQHFNAVGFSSKSFGTVVGTSGQIRQTIDGGKTWEAQNSRTSLELFNITMPLPYVTSVSGNRGSIYRQTNDLRIEAVPEQSPSTNSSFDIVSVYPNPAHDVSKLLLRLLRPMPMEAKLFDELGAEVNAFDFGMLQDGEFEIPLSLTTLASGTYILEVRSPEQVKHIQVKIVK